MPQVSSTTLKNAKYRENWFIHCYNYTDRMLNLKKQQFQRPSFGNLQQSKLGTWYANCKWSSSGAARQTMEAM